MRRCERGFALPMALFVMAMLTMLITAAFSKVAGDRRVADSSGAAVTAFAVAQSGLQTYMGTVTTRPADGDSTRVNVSSGYADVVVNIVYNSHTSGTAADTLLDELFLVRATGHVIDPAQGADPQASRTVAQFAKWQTGHMKSYVAPYTAAEGVVDYDASLHGTVTITRTDSTGCGGPTLAWDLRLPTGLGGGWDPPPGVVDRQDNSPAPEDVVGIADWDTLTSGGFVPDHTTLTDLNSWSTYFIDGSLTLTTSGTGLLIVKDSLVFSGPTVNWDGVILVGRRIIFGATNTTISGLLASGLRNQIAGYNTRTQWGGTGTTLEIKHNSCRIRQALQSLTGLHPIQNAWVDGWKTY